MKLKFMIKTARINISSSTIRASSNIPLFIKNRYYGTSNPTSSTSNPTSSTTNPTSSTSNPTKTSNRKPLRHVSQDAISCEEFKNSKPKNFISQWHQSNNNNNSMKSRKNVPFPLNPYFDPPRPISNETRKTIYNLFKSDPTKWTPRALAEQFGISILRVEAILRLKALETAFTQKNIAIQNDFVKGMEEMLDPITIPYRPSRKAPPVQYEPLRENLGHGLYPFTQLLDEENHLTPEDAAQILHLEPYQNIEKRLSIKANRVFMDKLPTSPPPKPITSNPVLGGKNDFMIVDTSQPDAPELLIRDKGGNLLPATPAQVYLKRNAKPKRFTM